MIEIIKNKKLGIVFSKTKDQIRLTGKLIFINQKANDLFKSETVNIGIDDGKVYICDGKGKGEYRLLYHAGQYRMCNKKVVELIRDTLKVYDDKVILTFDRKKAKDEGGFTWFKLFIE